MSPDMKEEHIKTIRDALSYLHAVADFLPQNNTLMRHIGKLNKMAVEIMSEKTN